MTLISYKVWKFTWFFCSWILLCLMMLVFFLGLSSRLRSSVMASQKFDAASHSSSIFAGGVPYLLLLQLFT